MAAGDIQPTELWGMGVEGVVGIAGSLEDNGLYHSLSTTRGLINFRYLDLKLVNRSDSGKKISPYLELREKAERKC